MGIGELRVLAAYEDDHRSYGQALEATLREMWPGVEVSLVRAEELIRGGREVGTASRRPATMHRSAEGVSPEPRAWLVLGTKEKVTALGMRDLQAEQTPATPDAPLVTIRSAVRIRSSALSSLAFGRQNGGAYR